MKYEEFRKIVNDLEEKEEGKLYDSKGRLRAFFNEEENALQLTERYFYAVSESIYNCYKGWITLKCKICDRETKKIIAEYDSEADCLRFLMKNYPNYGDPLAYWS